MTVTHVGTTRKYSANWDSIFAGTKRRGSAAGSTPQKPAAKKKSAKKKSTTKKSGKKSK